MLSEFINVIGTEWKLILCVTIVLLLYIHYTSTFDFFEKKNINYLKPTILVGNLGPRLLLKTSFHDFQKDVYNKLKGYSFGG